MSNVQLRQVQKADIYLSPLRSGQYLLFRRQEKKVPQQGSQQHVARDSLKEVVVAELARTVLVPALPHKKKFDVIFAAQTVEFLRAENSRVIVISGD